MWYKRHECGLRMAIFFSAATAAGAFGGLLAYGIMQMDGKGNLAGWSWIFILEMRLHEPYFGRVFANVLRA